jgi:hypothetical protein
MIYVKDSGGGFLYSPDSRPPAEAFDPLYREFDGPWYVWVEPFFD